MQRRHIVPVLTGDGDDGDEDRVAVAIYSFKSGTLISLICEAGPCGFVWFYSDM
jgi:hypothetical protein